MEGEHTTVVERDVDVGQAETELRNEKTGNGATVTPLARGPGAKGPMSRFEFVTAARGYKPKVTVVDLPAPFEGSQIKVRELTAGERDKYESKIVRGRLGNQKLDMTELRVGLIMMACVEWEDETTPLFREADKDDLRNMGISVIQVIYDAAAKLSAVSKEDEEELLGK